MSVEENPQLSGARAPHVARVISSVRRKIDENVLLRKTLSSLGGYVENMGHQMGDENQEYGRFYNEHQLRNVH